MSARIRILAEQGCLLSAVEFSPRRQNHAGYLLRRFRRKGKAKGFDALNGRHLVQEIEEFAVKDCRRAVLVRKNREAAVFVPQFVLMLLAASALFHFFERAVLREEQWRAAVNNHL